MTQPILLAPVTRAIAEIISDWMDDCAGDLDEDEIGYIACSIANELSAQPDPDDPRRWWITLPSADGTDPDMPCEDWTSDYRPPPVTTFT
jgi:hypothetical protein